MRFELSSPCFIPITLSTESHWLLFKILNTHLEWVFMSLQRKQHGVLHKPQWIIKLLGMWCIYFIIAQISTGINYDEQHRERITSKSYWVINHSSQAYLSLLNIVFLTSRGSLKATAKLYVHTWTSSWTYFVQNRAWRHSTWYRDTLYKASG